MQQLRQRRYLKNYNKSMYYINVTYRIHERDRRRYDIWNCQLNIISTIEARR